jgi:Mg-chelatase subunit ChlI
VCIRLTFENKRPSKDFVVTANHIYSRPYHATLSTEMKLAAQAATEGRPKKTDDEIRELARKAGQKAVKEWRQAQGLMQEPREPKKEKEEKKEKKEKKKKTKKEKKEKKEKQEDPALKIGKEDMVEGSSSYGEDPSETETMHYSEAAFDFDESIHYSEAPFDKAHALSMLWVSWGEKAVF